MFLFLIDLAILAMQIYQAKIFFHTDITRLFPNNSVHQAANSGAFFETLSSA